MVQVLKLDHLEYKEAIVDSPEFREKLRKHEKYISDTSKNIKVLLKKFEDVINACESKQKKIKFPIFYETFVFLIEIFLNEALKNSQDLFSDCLREFPISFVGDLNEEESDIGNKLKKKQT